MMLCMVSATVQLDILIVTYTANYIVTNVIYKNNTSKPSFALKIGILLVIGNCILKRRFSYISDRNPLNARNHKTC